MSSPLPSIESTTLLPPRTLRAQQAALANHPNGQIYAATASLLGPDAGCYLDPTPCAACTQPAASEGGDGDFRVRNKQGKLHLVSNKSASLRGAVVYQFT